MLELREIVWNESSSSMAESIPWFAPVGPAIRSPQATSKSIPVFGHATFYRQRPSSEFSHDARFDDLIFRSTPFPQINFCLP
jgi:hypothetical protein